MELPADKVGNGTKLPILTVGFDFGTDTLKVTLKYPYDKSLECWDPIPTKGRPLAAAEEVLKKLRLRGYDKIKLGVTGSTAASFSHVVKVDQFHEPTAMAKAIGFLYPEVETIVEMGRETLKYILLSHDPLTGKVLVEDCDMGSKCAAGGGTFLDYLWRRLGYDSIEKFAQVALVTENPAGLSGRCAVFTESDITHLCNRGVHPDRIAAGVHWAIAQNYKKSVAKNKEFRGKIAFVGGVSENPAMARCLAKELELGDRLFVPENGYNRHLGAIGVALSAESEIDIAEALELVRDALAQPFEYPHSEPLRLRLAKFLKAKRQGKLPCHYKRAFLGIDIGSVSTKAVLIAEVGGRLVILASWYRRTKGNPLEAVRDVLAHIHDQVKTAGYEIDKITACTTGSGRYLIANFIGAELVRNEITAQASGALFYFNDMDTFTIFEIGGQDSKYIRVEGGVVVDFEMNKACAAGTGSFLEKQAIRTGIPLEEIGDKALQSTKPPEVSAICAVLADSSISYFHQNNVSPEDILAGSCLSVAKSYLQRTVAGRPYKGKIIAQGATAWNKSLVAAYEAVTGCEILVAPNPHLTGAIGAARLAYLADDKIESNTFRGFEEIANLNYTVTPSNCKKCANNCSLSTFAMSDGTKFIYGDRCEEFSGVQKKKLGEDLPNLFARREEMLMDSVVKRVLTGTRKKVGIPRVGMFAEYYPLFGTFVEALGFEAVPSKPTNRHIVELGLNKAIGEPCFPFKVAHGHYEALIEEGIDIILAPRVISTEQPNPKIRQAQTCPYWQASPDVFEAALQLEERGITHITPPLHFKRGIRHLKKVFVEIGASLGKTKAESLQALEKGLEALKAFRAEMERCGKEVIANLGEKQIAYIVLGRPYTLWDPVINMGVSKKIQDMGILAIPMDFLPLESVDLSETWPNMYSRMNQKMLAAAKLIRENSNLRAVKLSYFACGLDAFGNSFFKDEIGTPCYIMQIDEHTGEAGVITRIEAFRDTTLYGVKKAEVLRPRNDYTWEELQGKIWWIPYATDTAHLLVAALRAFGIDARVLPRSNDSGLTLAREAISEDVCLPSFLTVQDMLARVNASDFDPEKEAFFIGNSEGPCRFGLYEELMRRILTKLGYPNVPVVTLGIKGVNAGFGVKFPLLAWDLFVAHDLLQKMQHRARPYELIEGESDKLFKYYLLKLAELAPKIKDILMAKKLNGIIRPRRHLQPIIDLLESAQHEFAAIRGNAPDKPLVGVVGEWCVRVHSGANQDIIRKLEQQGVETWLAPSTEFFAYANYVGKMLSWDRLLDMGFTWEDQAKYFEEFSEHAARWFNSRIVDRDEHILFESCYPFLRGYEDINSREVIEKGSKYVNYNFGGEAICSMGKAEDLVVWRKVCGIVSVIPFNCMPGNCVTAFSHKFRRRHRNVPFLNIDFDGYVESSRSLKIDNFADQAKNWHNNHIAQDPLTTSCARN